MIDNLKNPYEEMYHWCKGELYDLQSLSEAIATKDKIDTSTKRLESKKQNTQTHIENVN